MSDQREDAQHAALIRSLTWYEAELTARDQQLQELEREVARLTDTVRAHAMVAGQYALDCPIEDAQRAGAEAERWEGLLAEMARLHEQGEG